MDSHELKAILEKHKHWINRDCDGWENMRADLHCADLRHADLLRANLYGADLRGANLRDADLYGADLHCAGLRHADLQGADLFGADLRGTDLCDADLRHADLLRANLDFSCLPLWCGSLSANFDSEQLKQIAYHLVKAGLQSTNSTDEDRRELSKLIDYANGFHRAKECGFIKGDSEIDE